MPVESKTQIFDPLSPAIESALRASIKRFGVLVPVAVDQNGSILDGHHRSAIADELGVEFQTITIECLNDERRVEIARTLNADRRHLTEDQRREVAVELRREGHSYRAIGGALGVDEKTARNDIKKSVAEHSAAQPPKMVGDQTLEEFAAHQPRPFPDQVQPDRIVGIDGKSYPAEKSPEPRSSTFNRSNDNIEWALWTWNPVTGCEHTCDYCYAREIANRFTGHFRPEFHEDRLKAPANTKPKLDAPNGSNVFVGSMADMFGSWVPNEWIFKTLEQVRKHPEWNFLFLTKNPRRLPTFDFPDNAWIGATIDIQARVKPTEKYMAETSGGIKFISCEPMLEPITLNDPSLFDLVIIGARSRTSSGPEFQPECNWVLDLTTQAREAGCLVYWKPNLKVRPRELPGVSYAS